MNLPKAGDKKVWHGGEWTVLHISTAGIVIRVTSIEAGYTTTTITPEEWFSEPEDLTDLIEEPKLAVTKIMSPTIPAPPPPPPSAEKKLANRLRSIAADLESGEGDKQDIIARLQILIDQMESR